MARTLNTIYKVQLKERNGKACKRSIAIAKNTRKSALRQVLRRAREPAPKDRRCDKTLGINCPEDITKAEEATRLMQLNNTLRSSCFLR